MSLWTPAELSAALWLDAADASTMSVADGLVSVINDKSGSGRHASQSTASLQPALTSAALNGLDALSFDGVNDHLAITGGLPVTTDMSVFEVFSRSQTGITSLLMGGSVNGGPPYTTQWATDNVSYSALGSTGWSTHGAASSVTGAFVSALRRDSTTVAMWRNGAMVGDPTSALTLTGGSINFIGRRGLTYHNGKIYEIVAVASALSLDDRQRVEGYLAHKWGLASSLPADHPYKSVPPFNSCLALAAIPSVVGAISALSRVATGVSGACKTPLASPTGLAYVRRTTWAALRSPMDIPGGLTRGVVATPSLARSALRTPLASPTGLAYVRRTTWAALRSPMDIPGGLTRGVVATPSLARSALRTPLGMRTARARVRPSGAAALGTPLGDASGLTAIGMQARSALGTPLSIFRARVGLPSPTIATALPTTRPRLLADPLPLRRGTDLPEYRTDAYLPWVYGRVTLSPLPLDAAGLEWLVTDHPILAVTAVRDGEATVSGWALEQRLDATDHPIAVLRLARKPEGALAVSVAGRRHAQSGALIEHPADIAADLCARCGLPAGDWSALRAGWPGVALGSVLADAMPLREALSAVIGAVGARWSGAPLRAWAADSGTVLTTLDAASADDASAEADTASLATRLTVAWGWDWSTNSPRGSVIVEAPEAIARYGEIAAELSAPWLRTARDALALAHAELARRARPKWQIEIQTGPRSDRLRPGDRVDIDHPWLPAGPAEITHIAASSISQRITCEGAAGPVPRTQTVRRGALLDAEAEEPVSVSYRDGIATFTILDELGAPLSNAAVSLDGGRTYNTDRQGRVQIRTARGAYMLEVAAPGYAPMRMEVEV